jgi:hypothetical protein
VQCKLAHLSAAGLVIGTHPAFAELKPQYGSGAARVPEPPPDERSQRSLDLLSQTDPRGSGNV